MNRKYTIQYCLQRNEVNEAGKNICLWCEWSQQWWPGTGLCSVATFKWSWWQWSSVSSTKYILHQYISIYISTTSEILSIRKNIWRGQHPAAVWATQSWQYLRESVPQHDEDGWWWLRAEFILHIFNEVLKGGREGRVRTGICSEIELILTWRKWRKITFKLQHCFWCCFPRLLHLMFTVNQGSYI